MNASVRVFDSGATRDLDESKYDYEAFMSPLVLERYAAYMHANRKLADGTLRDGDNWQKGIPKSAYVKSAWRHVVDWWKEHRGIPTKEGIELAICGVLFNAMGYLHEHLKAKLDGLPPQTRATDHLPDPPPIVDRLEAQDPEADGDTPEPPRDQSE